MIFTILLILIYVLSLFVDTSILGVSTTSPWYTHLTYSFIHVNILHLVSNLIALHITLPAFKWRYKKMEFIPITFVVSYIVSFAAMQDTVTVGASAIIYSMMGLIVAHIPTKVKIKYVSFISISFVIQSVFSSTVNVKAHVFSFLLSVIIGYVHYEARRRYKNK